MVNHLIIFRWFCSQNFIDYRLQTPVIKVGFLLRASYIQQCSLITLLSTWPNSVHRFRVPKFPYLGQEQLSQVEIHKLQAMFYTSF